MTQRSIVFGTVHNIQILTYESSIIINEIYSEHNEDRVAGRWPWTKAKKTGMITTINGSSSKVIEHYRLTAEGSDSTTPLREFGMLLELAQSRGCAKCNKSPFHD